MANYKSLDELVKAFPNKADRESELNRMSNADIDVLIKNMSNVQGKIYLKSFKKA